MGNYHKFDHAVMREKARQRLIDDRPQFADSELQVVVMSDFDGDGHVAVHPKRLHGLSHELEYSFANLDNAPN